jgi:hypothetical protein
MEEMQGVMSLPQSGAARAPVDPQQEQVFQKLRQEVPPKQFSDELLGAASQADPQAVKAFVDELRSLEVPMDTLVMLNEMVDAILANPQDYERIRRQYMAQGIPEDVLPERFDAMFFAALNMALDQLTVQQAAPIGMAGGGIADLAQYGRHGDTMLAHITPEEAALLKSRGGSGTINPVTGLPEFFIGKLFKSIGNAVKKFAQSTIGRIVLPIALGFFVGPLALQTLGVTAGTVMGTAIQGFVGGAGAALLRGEGLGDAVKAGAIAGVTAGALQGATNAFGQSVTAGGTQAPIESYVGEVKTLVSPAQAAPPALPSVQELAAGNPSLASLSADAAPVQVGAPLAPRLDISSAPIEGVSPLGSQASGQTFAPRAAPSPAPPGELSFQESMTRGPLSEMAARPVQGPTDLYGEAITPPGGNAYARTPPVGMGQGQDLYKQAISPSGNMPPPPSPNTEPGFMDKAKGLYDKYLNPKTLGEVPKDVVNKAETAYLQKLTETGSRDLANKAYDAIIKAGTPGVLATYGPLAAAGLAATAALGGFESKPAAAPDLVAMDPFNPAYAKPLQFGGIYAPRGYYAPRPNPTYEPPPVRKAADGGIMALEMGGTTYPRKQGHIKGPGTGTSDSIPALLSDGEFVFTAKAVRNLGQGSRRKGAKRLYAMMKMLEGRKV